eukprot:4124087-Pyramimonas_sp.AAC.1
MIYAEAYARDKQGPPPRRLWTLASASTEFVGVECCRLLNTTDFQHRSCSCVWRCTTPRDELSGPLPSPTRA